MLLKRKVSLLIKASSRRSALDMRCPRSCFEPWKVAKVERNISGTRGSSRKLSQASKIFVRHLMGVPVDQLQSPPRLAKQVGVSHYVPAVKQQLIGSRHPVAGFVSKARNFEQV